MSKDNFCFESPFLTRSSSVIGGPGKSAILIEYFVVSNNMDKLDEELGNLKMFLVHYIPKDGDFISPTLQVGYLQGFKL